ERRAPLDAVDRVALAEQEFREIRAVLTGDAGDQRDLAHVRSMRCALPLPPIAQKSGETKNSRSLHRLAKAKSRSARAAGALEREQRRVTGRERLPPVRKRHPEHAAQLVVREPRVRRSART